MEFSEIEKRCRPGSGEQQICASARRKVDQLLLSMAETADKSVDLVNTIKLKDSQFSLQTSPDVREQGVDEDGDAQSWHRVVIYVTSKYEVKVAGCEKSDRKYNFEWPAIWPLTRRAEQTKRSGDDISSQTTLPQESTLPSHVEQPIDKMSGSTLSDVSITEATSRAESTNASSNCSIWTSLISDGFNQPLGDWAEYMEKVLGETSSFGVLPASNKPNSCETSISSSTQAAVERKEKKLYSEVYSSWERRCRERRLRISLFVWRHVRCGHA